MAFLSFAEILENDGVQPIGFHLAHNRYSWDTPADERIDQLILALGGDPDQAIHIMTDHLPENGLLDHWVITGRGEQQLAAAVIEQLADVIRQGGVVGIEQVGDDQADGVAALLA